MIKGDRVAVEAEKEFSRLKAASGLHWFHWLIVFSSFALTFFAWYFSSQQVKEKTEQQFLRQANQVVELISERMRKYEDALWSGVATIHAQSYGISPDEWQRFSSAPRVEQRYPGINGIGVIYDVKPDQLSSFVAKQRETRPEFTVYPDHTNGIYLPITYVEPVALNGKAIGLDVAHEKNRLSGALNARDTGEANITVPIVLVQDSEKTPGFLFYTPFYSAQRLLMAAV